MSYANNKEYRGINIVFLVVFIPGILLFLPKRGSDKKTSEQRAEERMKNMGLDKDKNWQEYYKIRAEEEGKIKKEILEGEK